MNNHSRFRVGEKNSLKTTIYLLNRDQKNFLAGVGNVETNVMSLFISLIIKFIAILYYTHYYLLTIISITINYYITLFWLCLYGGHVCTITPLTNLMTILNLRAVPYGCARDVRLLPSPPEPQITGSYI